MTVVLSRRADINLESYRLVAWEGDTVELDPRTLIEVGVRREQFLNFVAANSGRKLYGVNVHAGDGSNRLMTAAEQRDYENGLHSGTSFGEPLPRRVVRGIVLARLANFLEGHAGVSPELVLAVAARLDGRELPPVPRYGNGGAGEIQALGWLFADVPGELPLGLKEGMALINGSPCASALLADATLTATAFLPVAESVFALAAAAMRVPLATYDHRLDALWGDPFQARALSSLRSLLAGGDEPGEREPSEGPSLLRGGDEPGEREPSRRPPLPAGGETPRAPGHPQPPVSYRILPRVLGNTRRVISAAAEAAEIALPGVSDNPVFLFPDGPDDLGDLVSNGGFHSGTAPACIDALTFAIADLGQLAQHLLERLQTNPEALPGLDSLALGTMQMVAGGWAEEARGAAVPSLLPLSGFGQSDVPAPTFFAWNRFERVRGFVNGSLTCLAALAGQALARPKRTVPPALQPLLDTVLEACPPITERRTLGPELDRLADRLNPLPPTLTRS
jgi:histidine ammonia-lyase